MLPHPHQAPGTRTPRLYYHPVSPTCRPIMMFAAEANLRLDWRLVDLVAGEQHCPAFTALNANQAVPVLEDGDFRLTECSTILKYLADRSGSPAYPLEPRQRARVNEAMDWLITGLWRELGYGFVYPQLMPQHRREDAAAQAAALRWAAPRAARYLDVLDRCMLGTRHRFIAGPEITLADYLGLGLLTLGEVVGLDDARWPQLQRWLAHMKSRPAYAPTHEHFARFAAQAAKPSFIGL